MKRKLRVAAMTALFAVLLMGTSGAMACFGGHELKEMSVAEVAEALAAKRTLHIFDANSEQSYREAHVPTAQWVRFDAVTRERLPSDKAAPLLFYCYNERCSASQTAATQAIELGYTNVAIMPAGIAGWIEAKKPVERATGRS